MGSNTAWFKGVGAFLVVLLLAVSAGASGSLAREPSTCAGSISEPAEATTVISVQGFKFGGNDSGKKPAMLVGVGPQGAIQWVEQSTQKHDIVWSYDVDPMANGNLFVTATIPEHRTLVYEFDPETQQQVWTETFDVRDTHDADLLENGDIVVANMRNNVGPNETARDRIFVYNRSQEEIVWEWNFSEHFEPSVGGAYTGDWTHVNDVDPVGNDQFLVSPRNFDQVLLINRTTGEIDKRLGADGDQETLIKQHNPDYLESENGTATFLVADSENNRIVEYEQTDDGWNRTWELGADQLNWPRDADRLPNGNTLVSDSTNHRVIEVTPQGEVVWEFYAPWLVYDAVRLGNPNESGGPTMTDLGTTGTVELNGSAKLYDDPSVLQRCFQTLQSVDGVRATTDGAESVQTTATQMANATGGQERTANAKAPANRKATADVNAPANGGVLGNASVASPVFGPLIGLTVLLTTLALLAWRGRE